MRLALFSDIHANREALDACLAQARRVGVDRLVFLGDLVGYGPDPNAVVETVAREVARGALAIMGNHDAAAVARDDGMTDNAARAMEWTRKELTSDSVGFLRDLPMSVALDDVLIVHASPQTPERWPYVLDRVSAAAGLKACSARLVFVGHTHQPAMYHQLPDRPPELFRPPANKPVPLSPLRRWLTVSGAVGQPRDGNPAAAWGLLDLENATWTQQRAPYDIDATAAKIKSAGLPGWLGQRLYLGK